MKKLILWDIDGTIIEEHIAHAAGATSPLGLSRQKMVALIQAAGRVPVERDALYNELRVFDAPAKAEGPKPKATAAL